MDKREADIRSELAKITLRQQTIGDSRRSTPESYDELCHQIDEEFRLIAELKEALREFGEPEETDWLAEGWVMALIAEGDDSPDDRGERHGT